MNTHTRTARIVSVEPLDGFKLRLGFDDGTDRDIDLEGELWGPIFAPLHESPEFFRQVRVDEELGTVVWPNGADLDPDVLYGNHPPADTGAANEDNGRR